MIVQNGVHRVYTVQMPNRPSDKTVLKPQTSTLRPSCYCWKVKNIRNLVQKYTEPEIP